MKTISLILDSTEDSGIILSLYQHAYLLKNTKKIVLIFVAKERWFNFNDPRNALASMETLNYREKVGRRNIIKYLNEIEMGIREVNNKLEIVKIVVFGEEKYKVVKCLRLLKVEMCLFKNKKRSVFSVLFFTPLHEYVNEKLLLPVVLL